MEIQKRIETDATKRAQELVKVEKDKQKQKSAKDENARKQAEDDTTSRGSAGGRSQGARKRKATADANAEKVKVEKERQYFWAQKIMRQYDSEDGRYRALTRENNGGDKGASLRVITGKGKVTKGTRCRGPGC